MWRLRLPLWLNCLLQPLWLHWNLVNRIAGGVLLLRLVTGGLLWLCLVASALVAAWNLAFGFGADLLVMDSDFFRSRSCVGLSRLCGLALDTEAAVADANDCGVWSGRSRRQ